MKVKSKVGFWGRLQIFENVDGKQVLVYEDDNHVVDAGKVVALGILAGDVSTYINRMSIGNGNVPLTSPSDGDTALDNDVDIKALSSYSIDSVNKLIVFEATFNSGDYIAADFGAYDEEINELALFFGNDTMWARKTFQARPFNVVDNISLTFRWTVGII